uniref:Uncharacterized protein n=1 Tax=Arundo donax TaxID=35708 RepID=A0A0A9EK02_ARUDO
MRDLAILILQRITWLQAISKICPTATWMQHFTG